MKSVVILNPMADHGRSQRLAELIPRWSEKISHCDLWITEGPGHATALARSAVDQGFELVISAGGDGTVHEIVNGLMQEDSLPVPLGIIPWGSGNDYAYGLNLPDDPHEAFVRIFDGPHCRVDLARLADDRGQTELAMNGIGIGFDATVSIQTRTITRVHGFAMYMLAVLRTIALYYQTPRLQIRFDDQLVEQRTLMLSIGIGPRIGGGFLLTPDAIVHDALLDSCAVNPIGRLTMMRLLPKAMTGNHITSKHVVMRRSHSIQIISNMALPIHADGEIYAYHEDNVRRLTITSLPAALTIYGAAPPSDKPPAMLDRNV
ncbi:MAG: diacylglycerol kinase family lipid kinase [Chloroflexota bacterium]|nr:MAG: diacylglycerol kinase family lipid kinase [Chloroflexota bacterium]